MTRVAVAAPNAAAAEAGVRLAAEGGNAVDAALAAALVTMVTEIGLVSPGGGCFVSLQSGGGDPVTVDGWAEMPGRGLPPERFGRGAWQVSSEYGGGTTTTIGHGSVATPGALKALDTAHRGYGRAPWREVVTPAIEAARDGFPLGPTSALYLGYVHDLIFGWHPPSRAALHDTEGRVLPAGATVVVPGLAATLEAIAAEGADVLYTGDLAAVIAADMAANGGILTRADLAAYRAVVRRPLIVAQSGWRLATNPLPAIGGVILTALLALLDGLPAAGPWKAEETAALVEAQYAVLSGRLAALDREDDRLAAGNRLLGLAAGGRLGARGSPSTATVSVVDDAADACAVTLSSGYGSGVLTPGTGLWLNNALGEQELVHGGAHSLPVGTRLASNMAPTVARRGDGAALAIGSPGSDRIPTALAQVFALFAHGGLSLADAVSHPRVHVRVRDDVLVDHEADLALPDGLGLPTRAMPRHSMYFGGVAAALFEPGDGLTAVGDPRRTGAIAVSPA